ncbi:MAG: hypothetical protein ACUVWP_06265 [bacterium]
MLPPTWSVSTISIFHFEPSKYAYLRPLPLYAICGWSLESISIDVHLPVNIVSSTVSIFHFVPSK